MLPGSFFLVSRIPDLPCGSAPPPRMHWGTIRLEILPPSEALGILGLALLDWGYNVCVCVRVGALGWLNESGNGQSGQNFEWNRYWVLRAGERE